MKRSLGVLAAGLVFAASTVAVAAPYEDCRMQLQRVQDEQRRELTAEALLANEFPSAAQEHMRLMQEMNEQMHQQAMRELHRRQVVGGSMHQASKLNGAD